MKQFVIITILVLCAAVDADAQTYLDHLKQSKPGWGKVTVTQSREIDELVNGLHATIKGTTEPANTNITERKDITPEQPKELAAREKAAAEARKEAEARKNAAEGETITTTTETRKKVMRGSHKVTGYRVQAFAGGNTRDDKVKAQQTGDAIKAKYPEEPVYVHFYSPRWICRVGNYRTYQDAERMLKNVRGMGYQSATIVKGMITVNY